MKGPVKERWLELCEQAAVEQDTTRLLLLVREINALLDEKQRRLDKLQPWESSPPSEEQPPA
jgi:hypothetical protein